MSYINRSSGVFLPVSSLPGPYGIGSIGEPAFKMIDFLKKAGQSYWQVLPLVPTGYGDSPYQSTSSSAGNPYFIDLDDLIKRKLLTKDEVCEVNFSAQTDRVDYEKLYHTREPLLRLAYSRIDEDFKKEMNSFCQQEASWLEDFSLFSAIKHSFGDVALKDWPDKELRLRKPSAVKRARQELRDEIAFYCFEQYIFYLQWTALRKYASLHHVKIIGDLPIYVSLDSADVWAKPELFDLDSDRNPASVAGVPPDAFSETGQLWGNPLYNWNYHQKTGFQWWISRIERQMELFDLIRIDHFRAFSDYWSVPYGESTALKGHWEDGPGMHFINAVWNALPNAGLIAEDLGDLTEQARAFFKEAALPGMAVLVHSFSLDEESEYLPHNRPKNSVFYTSTHDSETFLEWLTEKATPEEHQFASNYLRLRMDEGLAWGAIKTVWASPAALTIAPMQDILGLGGDSRINRPSTLGNSNWQWRVRLDALNDHVADMLFEVTSTYKRLPIKTITDKK